MPEDQGLAEAARQIRQTVDRERGDRQIAKSWIDVTALLDTCRLPTLSPDNQELIEQALAAEDLRVQPPLCKASRNTKLRLLRMAEDTTKPQDLVGEGLVRLELWEPGRPPVPGTLADLADPSERCLVWVHVHPRTELAPLVELLRGPLPELQQEALDDLLQVDDLPDARTYGDVRKFSTFSVAAAKVTARRGAAGKAGVPAAEVTPGPESRSKAGMLVFEVIEFLAGPRVLLTCWNEPRATLPEEPTHEHAADQEAVLREVAACWLTQGYDSVAALALLLSRELTRSYQPTRRILHSWLEQWELGFLRQPDNLDSVTLRDLRSLTSELQRRLTGLRETLATVEEAGWLVSDVTEPLLRTVGRAVERSEQGTASLEVGLRSATDQLTTYGIKAQLELSQAQSEATGRLQDQIGLVTSVLLVPTFIAGLFGANTEVPGQGHWSGFVLMLALMVAGAYTAYRLFQRASSGRVRARTVRAQTAPAGSAGAQGRSTPG